MSEFGYYDDNGVWHPAEDELEQITVEIPKAVTNETNLHYTRPFGEQELQAMDEFDAARFGTDADEPMGRVLLIALLFALGVILLLIGFLIFVLPMLVQVVHH